MKTTNKFDLPQAFENFDKVHAYSKGDADISATTLIDSPKIDLLKRNNYREIESDISDNIMRILGTAVHAILQDGAGEGDRVEERLYAKFGDVTLSGQIDLMSPVQGGFLLQDYKTCGSFAVQASPEGRSEWVRQLNVYATLAEENGIDVVGLEVVAIIRDWTASGLKRYSDYPPNPVVRIPIPLWESADRRLYIEERLRQHEVSTEDSLCSNEERWARPTTFAVHKKSKGALSKRAVRLFDSMAEAGSYVLSARGEHETVRRPGENARCVGDYCGVSKFCKQWHSIQQ